MLPPLHLRCWLLRLGHVNRYMILRPRITPGSRLRHAAANSPACTCTELSIRDGWLLSSIGQDGEIAARLGEIASLRQRLDEALGDGQVRGAGKRQHSPRKHRSSHMLWLALASAFALCAPARALGFSVEVMQPSVARR